MKLDPQKSNFDLLGLIDRGILMQYPTAYRAGSYGFQENRRSRLRLAYSAPSPEKRGFVARTPDWPKPVTRVFDRRVMVPRLKEAARIMHRLYIHPTVQFTVSMADEYINRNLAQMAIQGAKGIQAPAGWEMFRDYGLEPVTPQGHINGTSNPVRVRESYWENNWGLIGFVSGGVAYSYWANSYYHADGAVYVNQSQYWRNFGGSASGWPELVNTPGVLYPPLARPMPIPVFDFFPELLPPLRQKPEARPVPWRVIPALPALVPGRDAGYGLEPAPLPSTYTPPYVEPGFDTETGARPSTRPIVTVGGHKRVPPGRRTKERKMRMPRWAGFVVGGITETADLIDVVFYSVPKHLRPKGKLSYKEKLEFLYRNINDVDMGRFFRNFLLMQMEDRAYGRIGKALGQASWNLPGNRGLQQGPWDTQGAYYDMLAGV